MKNDTQKITSIEPLDALSAKAAAFESEQESDPAQDRANAEAQAQAEAINAKLEAGVIQVVYGLLKVARTWLAKSLPEIRDEWTDDVLKAPAEAAVPLIQKHMAAMMQVIGSSPEAALMAFALLPMGLGVISAMDKADQREKKEQASGVTMAASDGG